MTGAGPAGAASPGLRWVILGSLVGAIFVAGLGGGLAAASDGGNDPLALVGSIITFISMPLLVTYFVSVLVWIHKSWSMLPYEQRVTDGGVRVTPGSAVGFLFVPFYNLYWYFIISVGLCSAYNRVLASYGSPKRAWMPGLSYVAYATGRASKRSSKPGTTNAFENAPDPLITRNTSRTGSSFQTR